MGHDELIQRVSSGYGIPVLDYARPGTWLLLGSGCGLMMAVMDAETQFRWCLDLDSLRDTRAPWAEWLAIMERVTDRICVAGWFSITNPAPLVQALGTLTRIPLVYAGQLQENPFRRFQCAETLAEFLGRLKEPQSSEQRNEWQWPGIRQVPGHEALIPGASRMRDTIGQVGDADEAAQLELIRQRESKACANLRAQSEKMGRRSGARMDEQRPAIAGGP